MKLHGDTEDILEELADQVTSKIDDLESAISSNQLQYMDVVEVFDKISSHIDMLDEWLALKEKGEKFYS